MNFGRFIYRARWALLAGWLLVAAALMMWRPAGLAQTELASFLPATGRYGRALDAMRESFPDRSGLSEAVIVFERPDRRLTGDDLQAIESLARRVEQPSDLADVEDLADIHVMSPADLAPLPSPLLARDGRAAIVIVDIPTNFITMRSAKVVDHIRSMIDQAGLPPGLEAAVTGSSGFGRDYALAAEESHSRTVWATLIGVIVILLLVYRAPLAALLPLGAVSLAAVVALQLLRLSAAVGMHVGTAEIIFVVVLLYGAGIDYSLLLISRYRELIDSGANKSDATAGAVAASSPAIFASAGTDTVGLLMLCFAQYAVFRTTGPAVGLSLVVALLAAVTLVPALLGMIGPRVFWPSRRLGVADLGRQRVWGRLAGLVTRRPLAVMLVTLAVLAAPAWQGTQVQWQYDTLADLDPQQYDAARGLNMVEEHWSAGQIAPVTLLVQLDKPAEGTQLSELSAAIARRVGALEHVRDVRSLSAPLGEHVDPLTRLMLQSPMARPRVENQYVGQDNRAIRLYAVLDEPPFGREAMEVVGATRGAAEEVIASQAPGAELHMLGATAEMVELRDTTQNDFLRIAVLVLGVILVMVIGLLRDVRLSTFMVLSTLVSYFATLGVTWWVFGSDGLDWKVQVFLFVVMVAVGQDYNIFLAARLAEEAADKPPREATRVAVIRTGPVISSCGLIMAATLGSLMWGTIGLMHQLGFALALGMLLDTFVVRPLLLPAYAALTGRTGKRIAIGSLPAKPAEPAPTAQEQPR
jgi:RND superfamily putative drug exporter